MKAIRQRKENYTYVLGHLFVIKSQTFLSSIFSWYEVLIEEAQNKSKTFLKNIEYVWADLCNTQNNPYTSSGCVWADRPKKPPACGQ
jgi:hypothetical protein